MKPMIRNLFVLALLWVALPCAETGPLFHFDFGERSGETAWDLTGSGLTASVTGSRIQGKGFGPAVLLDGSPAQRVQVNLAPGKNIGLSNFTLSAWICPSFFSVEGKEKLRRLFVLHDKWPRLVAIADTTESGALRFSMSQEGPGGKRIGTSAGLKAPLMAGRWAHVAVTCDRVALKLRLYRDGALEGEGQIPSDFSGAFDGESPVCLGSWQPFAGLGAEFKLWRRALSAEEVGREWGEKKAAYSAAVDFAALATPAPKDLVAKPSSSYFVAPNGRDEWTGTLAEPSVGRTDGPFATLDRARDCVRAVKKRGLLPAGGVTVWLRGGNHARMETFKLGAEDGGSPQSPIVYGAWNGEKPSLMGGRALTGFSPWKGQVLKADVGAQGLRGVYFRQLYYGGKRQVLARYPNFDPSNAYAGGYAYVDGVPVSMYQRNRPEDSRRNLLQMARDVRIWENPTDGEVNIFPQYNWVNNIIPIASVDPAQRLIILSKDVSTPEEGTIRPADRYYVRNLLEELDAPGEWFLDRRNWTLYFWPPGPIGGAELFAPVVENLVEISGASWITLRGLTLSCCEGNAVQIKNSDDCLVAACTVHDTGGRLGSSAGIFIDGGHRCGVSGCDVYDVCNYGIRLGGGDRDTLEPASHWASNNYVHHIGVLNGHGCGIYLGGIGLRVAHNLVHDTTRCGIFGGGNDCVVEYNHLRHVNLETEDTGGYYCGGNWHIRNQTIRYNYIHDVLGYGRKGNAWVSPYFCWGIYLDDDHSGAHVYGNVVARTMLGGAHIHAGRDNTIENNVFVEGSSYQMMFSGHDPKSTLVAAHLEQFKKFKDKPAYARYPGVADADLDTVWHMAGNRFERNIVFYTNSAARLYQYVYQADDVPQQNRVDSNLIWHGGLPLEVNLKDLPRGSDTWEAWRRLGFDQASLVEDPMFVDAARDDWRLKPGSPAGKIGFKPIPMEKIGPHADPLRATWPIVEAEGARERPVPALTKVDLPLAARPLLRVPRIRVGNPEEGPWKGEKLPGVVVSLRSKGEACALRMVHDGVNLYALWNVPASALKTGNRWGEHDGGEICLRSAAYPAPGNVFVLHGFCSGEHESVREGGASLEASKSLEKAVRFAAERDGKSWKAAWIIPFAAAGIRVAAGTTLPFNACIRRTESNEWIQWVPSGATWQLDQAGDLVLE